MNFSYEILNWYAENKRVLPWRSTRNPYNIWLSEVMLQQTRVAQGLPYYEKFIKEFPTVKEMASASEERVLKLWQGLGYYSRARNMHATAKMVVNEFNGSFPNTYEGLIKLKGVGDYTASAIASICFNQAEPVVDGNVYRVLARYYGIELAINSTAGIKHFKKLAREVMNTKEIRDYNQGIMEFGAIQCTPKKPYCLHCPLSENCIALAQNRVHELPVKLKKLKVKKKNFNYLIFLDSKKHTILEQRTGKGIWQNLYQFPLFESESEANINEVSRRVSENYPNIKKYEISLFNEKPIIHKLSHQHLHTKFWIIEVEGNLPKAVSWKSLEEYPVPVLIADFIRSF